MDHKVARRWRVILRDGSRFEQTAHRAVVRDGNLVFVRDENTVKAVAAGEWRECFELSNRREVER